MKAVEGTPKSADARRRMARHVLQNLWQENPRLSGFPEAVADALRRFPEASLAYLYGYLAGKAHSGRSADVLALVTLVLHGDVESLRHIPEYLRKPALTDLLALVFHVVPEMPEIWPEAANWLETHASSLAFDRDEWKYVAGRRDAGGPGAPRRTGQ